MAEAFSAQSLQFLKDIEYFNTREWYQENKHVYEKRLLAPLQRLSGDLSKVVLQIDPFIETMPQRTISRIYRDTRFSRDKSLYRGNIWMVFRRRGESLFHYPAFFFEIYPSFYHYGMGFYQASAQYMENYRKAIMENEEAFQAIISAIKKARVFELQGVMYKKNRYAGEKALVADWYNRRNLFLVNKRESIADIYNYQRLLRRLSRGFRGLGDIYDFLLKLTLS